MEIKHQLVGNKGSFYIEQEGIRVAEMEYSRAGDHRLIISHTEVSEVLKGKGAGKQLVAAAVEHARTNHLKILPLCPFARSVFEKVPEFGDVWDH
ncbi:MAG: GNAT family N-acetyltransferase [Azospira oryzae]|nr:MAG: GNAT family N-acetyltransferase [Azospira oryzae]